LRLAEATRRSQKPPVAARGKVGYYWPMDWTKIGALANIGCLVVAVVTLGVSLHGGNVSLLIPMLIAAVGGFICYSVVLWKKYQRLMRLPFRILVNECDRILGDYKKLAFDFPKEARLPLHPASVPNYGAVWEFHDALVYGYKSRLFEFLFRTHQVYEAHGITNYPGPFKSDANWVIIDLIDSLEALDRDLEKRL
jgi:hypothetical protein